MDFWLLLSLLLWKSVNCGHFNISNVVQKNYTIYYYHRSFLNCKFQCATKRFNCFNQSIRQEKYNSCFVDGFTLNCQENNREYAIPVDAEIQALQSCLGNPIFQGQVEEWTINKANPMLKYIIFNHEGVYYRLQVIKKNQHCNNDQWYTDQTNIQIIEGIQNIVFQPNLSLLIPSTIHQFLSQVDTINKYEDSNQTGEFQLMEFIIIGIVGVVLILLILFISLQFKYLKYKNKIKNENVMVYLKKKDNTEQRNNTRFPNQKLYEIVDNEFYRE